MRVCQQNLLRSCQRSLNEVLVACLVRDEVPDVELRLPLLVEPLPHLPSATAPFAEVVEDLVSKGHFHCLELPLNRAKIGLVLVAYGRLA